MTPRRSALVGGADRRPRRSAAADRRAAASSSRRRSAPSLVVAGAGSGKTETMAARVVWLLANGIVAARPGARA